MCCIYSKKVHVFVDTNVSQRFSLALTSSYLSDKDNLLFTFPLKHKSILFMIKYIIKHDLNEMLIQRAKIILHWNILQFFHTHWLNKS